MDNECEGFQAKGGYGGLGGGYVKHTALANVRQLSLLFEKKGRSDIDIVGVGGVASGRDAFELILCGTLRLLRLRLTHHYCMRLN